MSTLTVGETFSLRRHTYRQRRSARRLVASGAPWVFSRTACLGNDTYNLLGLGLPRLNIQKGRGDFLAEAGADNETPRIPWDVYAALRRRDVWPLLVEQEVDWWSASRPPEFVLMDSYSELTDQEFVSVATGARFFANFSDVDPKAMEDGSLASIGLIALEDLEGIIGRMFDAIHQVWPRVPVLFVHFPADLERRPRFLERAAAIRTIVETRAGHDSLVTSLSLKTHTPSRPQGGSEPADFPYHYDQGTYMELADRIRESMPRGLAAEASTKR